MALTTRVADETVTMEIDVKIVRAEAAGQAVVATGDENSEGTKLAVQRLVTTTAQTTVSVADGRTAILGGLVPDDVNLSDRLDAYRAAQARVVSKSTSHTVTSLVKKDSPA